MEETNIRKGGLKVHSEVKVVRLTSLQQAHYYYRVGVSEREMMYLRQGQELCMVFDRTFFRLRVCACVCIFWIISGCLKVKVHEHSYMKA